MQLAVVVDFNVGAGCAFFRQHACTLSRVNDHCLCKRERRTFGFGRRLIVCIERHQRANDCAELAENVETSFMQYPGPQ